MRLVKLMLFMLDHASARAIDRAGAEWIGGDARRVRAKAHGRLANAAMWAMVPVSSDRQDRLPGARTEHLPR